MPRLRIYAHFYLNSKPVHVPVSVMAQGIDAAERWMHAYCAEAGKPPTACREFIMRAEDEPS